MLLYNEQDLRNELAQVKQTWLDLDLGTIDDMLPVNFN